MRSWWTLPYAFTKSSQWTQSILWLERASLVVRDGWHECFLDVCIEVLIRFHVPVLVPPILEDDCGVHLPSAWCWGSGVEVCCVWRVFWSTCFPALDSVDDSQQWLYSFSITLVWAGYLFRLFYEMESEWVGLEEDLAHLVIWRQSHLFLWNGIMVKAFLCLCGSSETSLAEGRHGGGL